MFLLEQNVISKLLRAWMLTFISDVPQVSFNEMNTSFLASSQRPLAAH
jgi:hypothetical protein